MSQLFIFILFVLGMCLGSFILVVGQRLPLNQNILNDRSKCDSCHKDLKWWMLIPFFSYVFLRGKCHYCHQRISILNPLIEICSGTLFVISYLLDGISYEFFMHLIIICLMLVIFVSDFKYYIILDSPLVISIILIIILQLIYLDGKTLLFNLISGIVLFITMYLIKLLGDKMFKRESLGGGDIKFSFIIGLVMGFRLGLVVLILSTFLALPYCCASLMLKKNNEVPYGPFLVASLFIVFTFYNKFVSLLDLILISL